MVFSNLTFVCLFLPITLALYFSSPKWLHNTVLVLASIVFYIWGGRVAVILVLISIAVNFHLGQAIASALTAPGGLEPSRVAVTDPAPARRKKAGSDMVVSEMTMKAQD